LIIFLLFLFLSSPLIFLSYSSFLISKYYKINLIFLVNRNYYALNKSIVLNTKDFLKIVGIDPIEIYAYSNSFDKTNLNYLLLNSLKMNYEINHRMNIFNYLFLFIYYMIIILFSCKYFIFLFFCNEYALIFSLNHT